MAGVNGPSAASKAGCAYERGPAGAGTIIVPLFNRTYLVHLGEVRIEEEGSGKAPPSGVQLVILHYLINAEGTPPAGMWVTFRHVPDGMVFDSAFNEMAIEPLVHRFKTDIEAYRRACESLGGIRMTRTGDASYRFMGLPQIPMGSVLFLQDEEMSATVSILFDAVASNYLCAEDLAFLGLHLSESLIREATA